RGTARVGRALFPVPGNNSSALDAPTGEGHEKHGSRVRAREAVGVPGCGAKVTESDGQARACVRARGTTAVSGARSVPNRSSGVRAREGHAFGRIPAAELARSERPISGLAAGGFGALRRDFAALVRACTVPFVSRGGAP